MSQSRQSNPKYRHYKPKNLGVVRIDGKDHYLGRYDSSESWEKYHRLVAEWLSRGQTIAADTVTPAKPSDSISINEMLLAYWQFAETYYSKDGKPAKELESMKEAIWPVRHLYGTTKVTDFGPRALKAVQQYMVAEQNLCRNVANHRLSRIKRVFKWAVAEELVPPSVFHGLLAVAGLRYGRSEARETEPIKPVDDKHVDAVLPFVTPHVAAMIQVQRLTGMRPDDVVSMRPGDIDRSADVWVYERHDHKNRWRGHQRLIPIGPKAQAILQPFLDRDPEAFLFSPKESEAWRQNERLANSGKERKTKVYPCELRARAAKKEVRKRRKPKRQKHDRYDTASYRRAIDYGFAKAKAAGVEIPHWHPNQLRHTRGTEVRRDHGIEAAQVVLGHARADVTQVYAEKNLQKAVEIARLSG